jgi:succinyl-diaminopimelate desuccinylase
MSDDLRDDLVQRTCDLVRFASTADQPGQVAACAAYIRDMLDTIPGLFIEQTEREGRPSIVATLRDTRTPTLMLNGHFDVVAAAPELFEPRVQGGRIYGRGTQDMKGSVAVLLRLLKDLAALSPRPDVGVQFVGDEETGGEHGTGRLITEGWLCDFFVAAEPTAFRICYEQKGSIWITLRLPGVSAHGSHPWEGENPIFSLGTGLQAVSHHFPIPRSSDEWRTTATPTVVSTPNKTFNRVPNEVMLSFDIRHIAEDMPDEIVKHICTCFPNAEIVKYGDNAPMITDPDAPGVRGLAAAVQQVCGYEATLYRESYGSDARFYTHRSIPAVCFGPVGGGLHSDEEWVEIASLVDLYRIFRVAIEQKE